MEQLAPVMNLTTRRGEEWSEVDTFMNRRAKQLSLGCFCNDLEQSLTQNQTGRRDKTSSFITSFCLENDLDGKNNFENPHYPRKPAKKSGWKLSAGTRKGQCEQTHHLQHATEGGGGRLAPKYTKTTCKLQFRAVPKQQCGAGMHKIRNRKENGVNIP